MVQIQKQDRKRVYTYLLKEGVVVIHKDFSLDAHKATGVPNLQVWMLLRSLKDKGHVELIFNWQYYYYFLNENGKKYLAEFLGLTEEVVPLTWKYIYILCVGRMKKDNMNFLMIRVELEKLDAIVIMLLVLLETDLLAEEEVVVEEDHQELRMLLRKPKKNNNQPQQPNDPSTPYIYPIINPYPTLVTISIIMIIL